MEFRRGRFIVIDGTDSSGKKTQTKLLIKRLISQGHEVHSTSFPQYGQNIFARIVGLSLDPDSTLFESPTKINPYLISLAYAGDRWKAAESIETALGKGEVVVSDRYTSANMGHQAGKIQNPRERFEFLEFLKMLEFSKEGFNIPKPDLVIILNTTPEVSRKLIENRGSRGQAESTGLDGHESDMNHQNQTSKAFLEVAKSEPTWRVVNCMDETGEKILEESRIAEAIWEIVRPHLSPLAESKQNFGLPKEQSRLTD